MKTSQPYVSDFFYATIWASKSNSIYEQFNILTKLYSPTYEVSDLGSSWIQRKCDDTKNLNQVTSLRYSWIQRNIRQRKNNLNKKNLHYFRQQILDPSRSTFSYNQQAKRSEVSIRLSGLASRWVFGTEFESKLSCNCPFYSFGL